LGLQIHEGGDAEKESQRTPKTTTRRVLFSNLATPDVSFAAALRGSTQQQHRPQACQVAVAGPATMEPRVTVPLHQHEHHAGHSIGSQNVNSLPLDNSTLRIVAAVEQFKTEFNGAVSE
jgi:hypothetical protein